MTIPCSRHRNPECSIFQNVIRCSRYNLYYTSNSESFFFNELLFRSGYNPYKNGK